MFKYNVKGMKWTKMIQDRLPAALTFNNYMCFEF